MITLYLIPPIIAFLLLAAHFFRSDNLGLVLVCVLASSLVLVQRPWAARTIQFCLLLGSAEWLHSTISLVLSRSQMGQPFIRLAMILGGVTLFTALTALVFQTRKVRARFNVGHPRMGDKR